jgi:hypothetical protein
MLELICKCNSWTTLGTLALDNGEEKT